MPLEQIVAQLNIDMIGRSRASGDQRPANASLTGPERGLRHRIEDDEQRARRAERARQRGSTSTCPSTTSTTTRAIPNGSSSAATTTIRAAQGIPIIFYFSGVHEDYHRVSDEVSRDRLREDGEGRAHDLRDRAGAGRRADAAGRRSEAARGDDRTLNSYQRPATSDQRPVTRSWDGPAARDS